jgi:hypothetical protein
MIRVAYRYGRLNLLAQRSRPVSRTATDVYPSTQGPNEILTVSVTPGMGMPGR